MSPDSFLRLGALALFARDDAPRLRDKLRLSNATYKRLEHMARVADALHGAATPPHPAALQTALFVHGRQALGEGLALAHCTSGAFVRDSLWTQAYALLRTMPEPKLPFSGADLLARGLSPGPHIGHILKQLQTAWIKAGFPQDSQSLNQLLNEHLP